MAIVRWVAGISASVCVLKSCLENVAFNEGYMAKMTAARAIIVAIDLNKMFTYDVLLVAGGCSFDDMGSSLQWIMNVCTIKTSLGGHFFDNQDEDVDVVARLPKYAERC